MYISGQPAILAGITSISTVEARGAVPPGTYTPARCMGRIFWPITTPGRSFSMKELRFCLEWKARMFSAAVLSTLKNSGSAARTAASISSSDTARLSSLTRSNFSVYAFIASSPFAFTSAMIWETMPVTSILGWARLNTS